MSNISVPLNPLTAFGDMRVAELSPIIQVSFEYTTANTEIGTATVAGTGTVTQATAMAVVGSGTTTASTASWETLIHARYRAGLGSVMRFTGLFTSGIAGTEQTIGLADEAGSSESFENGFAVGYIGTVFGFHRWQNDVLTTVAQSAWDDPMDGTGASGMTLDPTKLNVFFIQVQYLGAGAIKLWIEDDSSGTMVLAHTILYANLNTTPSVYNPNFRMIAKVRNLATTSDVVVKSASMGYFIEGRAEFNELQRPQQSSGLKEKTTVTTEVAIFTIRNKSTYASKTNLLDLILENISASVEASSANNLAGVRLVKNATLGGSPSYADISATDSIVDIDVAGTTVTGGKTLLNMPLAGKNDRENTNVLPYKFILGPGETVTIAGLSANSATIDASLLWKELF